MAKHKTKHLEKLKKRKLSNNKTRKKAVEDTRRMYEALAINPDRREKIERYYSDLKGSADLLSNVELDSPKYAIKNYIVKAQDESGQRLRARNVLGHYQARLEGIVKEIRMIFPGSPLKNRPVQINLYDEEEINASVDMNLAYSNQSYVRLHAININLITVLFNEYVSASLSNILVNDDGDFEIIEAAKLDDKMKEEVANLAYLMLLIIKKLLPYEEYFRISSSKTIFYSIWKTLDTFIINHEIGHAFGDHDEIQSKGEVSSVSLEFAADREALSACIFASINSNSIDKIPFGFPLFLFLTDILNKLTGNQILDSSRMSTGESTHPKTLDRLCMIFSTMKELRDRGFYTNEEVETFRDVIVSSERISMYVENVLVIMLNDFEQQQNL